VGRHPLRCSAISRQRKAESTGHVNPKYGTEPGHLFYTHITDQYSPFYGKPISVGVRDSTYVLDGLLYHESELRIEEHYTDTAGFTDHVFALMHLLDLSLRHEFEIWLIPTVCAIKRAGLPCVKDDDRRDA
jgi:TnpA family transposase